MADFSAGDVIFIILILCLIHGIMQMVGWVRRCKAQRRDRQDSDLSG